MSKMFGIVLNNYHSVRRDNNLGGMKTTKVLTFLSIFIFPRCQGGDFPKQGDKTKRDIRYSRKEVKLTRTYTCYGLKSLRFEWFLCLDVPNVEDGVYGS